MLEQGAFKPVYLNDFGYLCRDIEIRAIISREFPGLCIHRGAFKREWRISHIKSGLCVLSHLLSAKEACFVAVILAEKAAEISRSWEEPANEIQKWAGAVVYRHGRPWFVITSRAVH